MASKTDRDDMSGQDDLAWLAWRYLLAELTPEETAEFEARLEDDECAAVELARAVRLEQAVAAVRGGQGIGEAAAGPRGAVVGPAAVRKSFAPPDSGRLGGRLIAGLTLAVLVAVATTATRFRWPGGGPRPEQTAVADPARAAALVRLWSTGPNEPAASDEPGFEEAGVAADELPGWLLAAVSLQQKRQSAPAGDEPDDEIL